MRSARFFSRFCSFTFVFLVAHTAAYSQPALEDYGALPTVQMVALSPDGNTLAFRRHSPEQDLLVVYSLEENTAVQAVDISSIRPRQLYFLDHSRVVMVASEDNKRIRGYRGKHDISTAFALDVTTGEVSQLLTPGDVIYKGQLGLGRIVGLSPDGEHVYMPAYVGRSRQDRNPGRALVEVNLESVRRPRVAVKGSHDTVDYFVDADGSVLVREIFNNRADYHSLLVYDRDKPREIYREETEIPTLSVRALTPDRKSLIVVKESESTDRVTYFTMSLADGSLSEPEFVRADEDVQGILTDINRVAYGVVYAGLSPSYEFFDDAITKRVEAIAARFPQHSVWLSDWTPDWQHLVVKVEGSTAAGDYYLFSNDGSARFLTSARPEVRAEDINPIVTYEYAARDGLKIPALLTIPSRNAENPRNLPAVILPHGGPQAHDWLGFDWMAQALASRGYAVLQPQFRGSTGFGVTHTRAGRGEWGRKMQDDLIDGLNALVKEMLVDPERVCIMGSSYGGYAALAGGAFTPKVYKCVVSINGVADLRKMLDSEKSDHGRYHWALAYWEDIIAKGDANRETLTAISPAKFPQNFLAPVLLLHGDRDTVVPYDQSKYMYKQLKRAKKPVKLVKLKGEDHHLSRPEARMESLKAAVEFIDTHIGATEL